MNSQNKSKQNIAIYIMGVSGCGKSTIGEMLSKKTNIPFIDGDDFHPKHNINKMQSGIPLTDSDRYGWLEKIHAHVNKEIISNSIIVACSALKQEYRDILSRNISNQTHWVFLSGCYECIAARIKIREGHFMPEKLLLSQFETLEPPSNAQNISIELTMEQIVNEICKKIPISFSGV